MDVCSTDYGVDCRQPARQCPANTVLPFYLFVKNLLNAQTLGNKAVGATFSYVRILYPRLNIIFSVNYKSVVTGQS
ncbi:MAG TPA: hypothetical protein VEG44_01355 [Candidatus Acidoferrales bacterium]|nr:hypothetical protein [Candidatus Acidoferrales bacterium]